MPRIGLLVLSTLVVSSPGLAQDREWTPEVSASLGLGHVFRFDDQSFGNALDAGAGIAIAHRSGIAFELAVDRAYGLEPEEAPCGLVGNTCVGRGRYGPYEATVASLGVQYRFGEGRLQPFVFAGLGALWTASFQTITYASTTPAVMVETESRDRGFGPDLGAGLTFSISPRVAIGAEIRWLDAPWLSRENLAFTRLAGRASYAW